MAGVLTLVRHGQSEANARGLICGRSDHALTPTGVEQAHALAAGLGRPTRVVTSPLLRARATASVIAEHHRTGVETDDRWIELDYGTLDGRPAADLAAFGADPDHAPDGGEALAAVGARVRAACTDLAADAASGEVVVVSHVSPIKAAIAWALGVDMRVAWRMFLVDAAVCRIDTRGPTPILLAVNDTGPLHAGAVQPA